MSVVSRAWAGARDRLREPSLAELDDETLVARASSSSRSGSRPDSDPDGQHAFGELVRRHQGKVRGLLLRLTANPTLADDLAQEVFLRAYRGLVGFEGRSRFSTWLYRIAYNVFLNHRTRTREVAGLPDDYELLAAAPQGEFSPVGYELRRDLDEAVTRLPERYRAVVTLYYLQDVSYPEIAEVLDLPLGTVKTHLHRAKKMLRELLQGRSLAAVDPDGNEVPA